MTSAVAQDAQGMATPVDPVGMALKKECAIGVCPQRHASIQAVIPNESLLYEYTYNADKSTYALRDRIMDPAQAKGMREEYEAMTREYEVRERYDIATPAERQNYLDRMNGFTRYVLRMIFNFQITEGISKAEKNSEEVKTFKKGYETAGKIVNSQTAVQVNDRFKFGTKADLPRQHGEVWMNSNYVNGSIELNLGKGWNYDLWQKQSTRLNPDETYTLRLSRTLPIWSVDGGLSYGGTTTRMTASLGKQLTERLRCDVYAVRASDPARAGLSPSGERAVRFSYGFTF